MHLSYMYLYFFAVLLPEITQGLDSSLIRTKRKPFSEYDYIEESKNEVFADHDPPIPIRTQRQTVDKTSDVMIEKPITNIFEHLIQKSKMKHMKMEKRNLVARPKPDPFLKLKSFFDELNKKSADETVMENKRSVHSTIENINKAKVVSKKAIMEDLQFENEENKNEEIMHPKENLKKKKEISTPKNMVLATVSRSSETNSAETDEVNDVSGSGSAESGSGESGDGSGESESGSGTPMEFSKDVNKRSSTEDNYDELFENPPSLKKQNGMGRNKRQVRDDDDEEGNPDFEGLPEHLATIRRENPRVKILKREAKDKYIPDIPLPFNDIAAEVNPVTGEIIKKEVKHVMKRLVPYPTKQPVKIIPYRELKSVNVIKRALTEEELKNLRIIDEEKAKSLFDDDEGDFLKHVKKDGIYYDTRHKRFLITANADSITKDTKAETKRNNFKMEKVTSIPKRHDITSTNVLKKRGVEKRESVAVTPKQNRTTDIVKKSLNNASGLKKVNTNQSLNETAAVTKVQKINSTVGQSNVDITNITTSNNATNSSSQSQKENPTKSNRAENNTSTNSNVTATDSKIVKRDLSETEHRKPLKQSAEKPKSDILKMHKRDILSDDDPNIDELMRTQGKEAEMIRHGKSMKTAENVYKFARSVMNLVNDAKSDKTKRHSESTQLTGVWSGLGTAPEFVPGLIKRDYDDRSLSGASKGKRQADGQKDISRLMSRRSNNVQKKRVSKRELHVNEDEFKHASRKRTHKFEVNAQAKRNVEHKGIWTGEHGFPLYREIHTSPTKIKRDADIDTDEDDVKTPKEENNEDLPLLSKRDVIPSDEEDEKEKKDKVSKEKREITEQMEMKQMELGSLGSINMTPKKTKKIKRDKSSKRQSSGKKSKRSDNEMEKEMISHLTTTPVQDGNVVLAFDEVKELLPTKRFFSQDEEQVLEPINQQQTAVPSASVIDIDKELADSMILAGEKRSNVYPGGLTATKIEYENNSDDKPGNERSKLNPSLLQKDNQLKKGQLAKVQSEETQRKYDQMRNWVQDSKDPAEIENERKIQEVSDQLAESNTELEKLKVINKAESDSAYLAKKLEEKNNMDNDSVQFREEKFKKLQQQILDEQEIYRKLVDEQRKLYEEKMKAEQPKVGISESGKVNTTTENKENEATMQNNGSLKGTSSEKGSVSATETPLSDKIPSKTWDALDMHIGDQHNQTIATPQTWEHFDRLHNDSSETFPEANNEDVTNETAPASEDQASSLYPKIVITTTSTPMINITVIPESTTTTMFTTTLVPETRSESNTSKQIIIESTTPPPTTATTTVSTLIMSSTAKSTITPASTTVSTSTTTSPPTTLTTTTSTLPSTTSSSSTTTTTTSPSTTSPSPSTSPSTSPSPSTSSSTMLSTTISSTTTNAETSTIATTASTTTVAPIKPNPTSPVAKTATAYVINVNMSSNNSAPTKSIISSAENSELDTESSNVSVPSKEKNAQDAKQISHLHNVLMQSVNPESSKNIADVRKPIQIADMNTKFDIKPTIKKTHPIEKISNEEKLPPTKTALPFPLEIAYRPRVVSAKNKTSKNLEIEPRADGYVGCFIDHLVQGRDLPVRAGIPFVTPTNCRTACKKTGYKYAGLQYGYLCFCGNNYGKYDVVPDSECNTVCSGNDSFTCGGLWRNEIYDTEHVIGTYEGNVPFIMPPKVRTSMTELPGMVRSIIPSGPNMVTANEKMESNQELLKEIQDSEQADIKALEDEKQDAIDRSNINVVRKVGNYTDEDLINAAKLEMALDQATQSDVHTVNRPPDNNPVPSSTTESPAADEDDDHKDKVLASFAYLHPQHQNDEEPKHSPVLPLKLEPGTHLFRGEIMLQQSWYDDLSKPGSIKFNILAANIEEALKNVFVNDTSFLKAEVMSLREDSERTPHKTIVDFTMTFKQNETTETVTHKLFDSVLKTKRLDEMPVLPHTLKVKEYLHDSNAQAYIPQVVDGQLHLDTSAPIELQYNSENKLVIPDKNTVQQSNESPTTNVIHPDLFSNDRKPTLGLSSMLPLPATAQHVSGNANMAPLNPAVQTHIRPMSTNGMAELKNYMQSQTLNENPELRGVITRPNKSPNMQTNHLTSVTNSQAKQQSGTVKKKKVPYVLRMFFWKDMLARKKREDNVGDLTKFNQEAKKVIHFDSSLPVIRTRRAQADEWPTVYKKDDQKRGYLNKSSLKRRKRVIEKFDSENEDYNKNDDDSEFESLFTNLKPRLKRSNNERAKKELVSDSLLKNNVYKNKSGELGLLRNKRQSSDDEDDDN